MTEKYDVAVLGAGAAGLFTAIFLAKQGISTVVISKGFGATAMSSGCFDILGYARGEILGSYKEGYNYLSDAHPYRVVSDQRLMIFEKLLKEGLSILPELFGSFLIGDYRKNMLVITYFGSVKPTAFLQSSMQHSILEEDRHYLFLGFKNMYDYNPALQASLLRNYSRILGLENVKVSYQKIQMDVPLELRSIYFFGRLLKYSKRYRETLVKDLKALQRKGHYDAILIPAIFEDVEDINYFTSSGIPLSETPSPPQYKAGLRLNMLLKEIAEKNGVKIIFVDDVRVIHKNKRIINMNIVTKKKRKTIHAEFFVLATGDFIGGGLKSKGIMDGSELRNRIYDSLLEVELGTYKMEKSLSNDLFDPNGHKISKSGFKIDENCRPINNENNIIFENLFVAGSVIGNYDYNVEKSGLGVPFITAYKVARHIANILKK